ncbi:hypothetical protein PILCRDRAFT_753111 [Piloderma croceum F 1598]|uniref:Uncharacterized protein n=1 Tax=Piloderma croceum (strain F 1598) TaxID=765440 RepID=A0A0C3ACI5_PILCF|nr:hypothetical protein PILCRDRAFT_753111 [Piloderma croceum F 1598]
MNITATELLLVPPMHGVVHLTGTSRSTIEKILYPICTGMAHMLTQSLPNIYHLSGMTALSQIAKPDTESRSEWVVASRMDHIRGTDRNDSISLIYLRHFKLC